MSDISEEFRKSIEHWADVRGLTKKQLYRFISSHYGKSGYWMDSRDRGVIKPTEFDLEWVQERINKDPKVAKIIDVPQYTCYDCEDVYPGKPHYTMIPARGDDPGAFLCHVCFDGLEKKGFTPDVIE